MTDIRTRAMPMEGSGRQDRGSLRSEQHVRGVLDPIGRMETSSIKSEPSVREVQMDTFGKHDRSSLKSEQSVKGVSMSGRHEPARSEHFTKE
ncbi:seipin isoform X2 [Rhincodon typus]|uniref:seipin isoform X2 n=1 Tax=Rhincodon typus TaxID=259920 RepID=UPI00202ED1CA|nr:seipin isoform X2 [Rhincodon typus]